MSRDGPTIRSPFIGVGRIERCLIGLGVVAYQARKVSCKVATMVLCRAACSRSISAADASIANALEAGHGCSRRCSSSEANCPCVPSGRPRRFSVPFWSAGTGGSRHNAFAALLRADSLIARARMMTELEIVDKFTLSIDSAPHTALAVRRKTSRDGNRSHRTHPSRLRLRRLPVPLATTTTSLLLDLPESHESVRSRAVEHPSDAIGIALSCAGPCCVSRVPRASSLGLHRLRPPR